MPEDTLSSKKVFLSSLTREEQLSVLWDNGQYLKNEQAKDKRDHIKIRQELDFVKGEVQGIGRRGKFETHPTMTTSQKISLAINNRAATWIWYRDKVLAPTLAAVHTIIILALLYFIFGGVIPSP